MNTTTPAQKFGTTPQTWPTYQYIYWWEPNCPYKNNCKSKGHLCNSCKHNKNNEDHYEPTDGGYIITYG